MTPIIVFVYGTLRLGGENHHFLDSAKLLSVKSWTYGKLYDTGFGYPAMIEDRSKKVIGELYEINEELLASLDQLEDYMGPGKDNLYERIIKTIFTEDGEVEAYVYIFLKDKVDSKLEISSGDWKSYRLQQQLSF